MVLINAGPELRLTESHVPGTDVRPHFRSIRLIPEPVAIALRRRARGHPELAVASGVITGHHRSTGPDRVDPRSDLERRKARRPSIQRRRRSRSRVGTIPHLPCDQHLVEDLLLDREVRVRPVSSEQDHIAVEDLDIHIGGRSVEHDRPCER